MPLRGNQFRNENSFRDEPKSKATTKSRIHRETAEVMPKFKLNDDRTIKIVGLFFLIVSLYFMVAFTSYLFTWKDDQSYVMDANGGWGNLWKTQAELTNMGLNQPVVENWLGKFGALLSHQFIYEWFGVASFIFIGVFFIVGYRLLFKIKVFSISKTLAYSFFLLIFISVTLAFFHAFLTDYPHYIEGEFGFWTNRLLQAQIGNAGTAGLIAFAGLAVLIIAYNIDFKFPERNKETKSTFPDSPENIELEEELRYEPVEFNLPNRSNAENGTSNKINQNLPPLQTVERPDPEQHVNVVLSPSRNVPLETADTVVNEIKETPPLTIEVTEEEKKSTELVEQFGMYDPTLDLSSYKYPPLDLLENYGSNKIAVNSEELEANKNKIVETLNHYNIEIDKIKATIGPTVTLYEIIPAPGVRISKIKNLEDDIALSLAALGIRIIAPMPGKGTIGIEVPNQHPEMVSMRSVLATEKFQNTTMDLPIALGKTISNEVYIADLSKMPHLLVAGATGQGKSVGINAILISLLLSLIHI